MLIGIDFDNTIVNYGDVFRSTAAAWGLISPASKVTREEIRDRLNSRGQASDFTRLQGYVYGPGVLQSVPYTGFKQFVLGARLNGHEVFVASHKTRFPIEGPRYDLRSYARQFLLRHGLLGTHAIANNDIHFEPSLEQKMKRIQSHAPDVFIDDLPQVLTRSDFPGRTQAILFDPEGQHAELSKRAIVHANDWDQISLQLMG